LDVTVTSTDDSELLIVDPSTGARVRTATVRIPAGSFVAPFRVEGVPDGVVDADFDLDGDNGQWITVFAEDGTRTFNRGAIRVKVTNEDRPDMRVTLYRRSPDGTRGTQITSLKETDGAQAAIGVVSITNLENRAARAIWGDPFVSQPIEVTLSATLAGGLPADREVDLYGGDPNNRYRLMIPAGATEAEFVIDARTISSRTGTRP